MRTRYKAIARVEKTHGKKGEVVTVPVGGLPLVLHEGLSVAIVPPALKGDRVRTVESCSSSGSGQLVRLSGIDGLDAASKLVGKTLLCREEDLPSDFGLHDVDALIGREVEDRKLGPLGEISEVMVGPANDVWVIDGPFGEVLMPVIDEVVDASAVAAEGPILVSLPDGLVGDGAAGDGEAR